MRTLFCATLWLISLSVSAFELDFDSIKKSVGDAVNTISETASESGLVSDDVKEVLSSSSNVLKEYSVEEETEIGKNISGRLLGASQLVPDHQLQLYVNKVGRTVAAQSERKDLTWHFGVIQSPDVNAFAAPGGYVFVTKGLYQTLNSEAELAGVLAHEIAHVTKGHHLALLKKSSMINLGKLAAEKKIGDSNNKIIDGLVGNGAEIMARSLDKNSELEADTMGVVLAARAGYDPYALPIVLQQIGHSSASNASSTSLLFTTHPHPNERLDNLMKKMGTLSGGATLANRFYRLKTS